MSLRLKLALTIVVATLPLFAGMTWLRGRLEDKAFRESLESYVAILMGPLEGGQVLADSPERWGGNFPMRGPRPDKWRPEQWRNERRSEPGRSEGGRSEGGRGQQRRGDRGERGGRRGRGRGRWNRLRIIPMSKWGRRERVFPRRQRPLDEYAIWAYGADFESKNPRAPKFLPQLREQLETGARVAYVQAERPPPRRPSRSEPPKPAASPEPAPLEFLTCAVRSDDAGPGSVIVLQGTRLRRPDPFWWMPLAMCAALLMSLLFAAGPMVRRIRRLTDDVRTAASSHYEKPIETRGGDEIAKLGTAFNEAGARIREHVESLEQRDKTLRSFIGNTTHDVMTPLTVLQNHLSTVRQRLEAGQQPDPQVIVSAQNEAHYMGSILHNLSAVAKLEAADLQVRSDPVDLNQVVERAVARHKPMANARDIALEHTVPEEATIVIGDVTLIEQAISNVIHNAVRYNNAGGHVAALLELQKDNTFTMRVIDDGPGIDDHELARLPERRFRGAEARTRDPDGLGLGLHIARDVAKQHDFELSFERSEYGGLAVTFRGSRAIDESAPISP